MPKNTAKKREPTKQELRVARARDRADLKRFIKNSQERIEAAKEALEALSK